MYYTSESKVGAQATWDSYTDSTTVIFLYNRRKVHYFTIILVLNCLGRRQSVRILWGFAVGASASTHFIARIDIARLCVR